MPLNQVNIHLGVIPDPGPAAPIATPAPSPYPLTIIHSTDSSLLPSGWHSAFGVWSRLCQSPHQVEYLLVIDKGFESGLGPFAQLFNQYRRQHVRESSIRSVFGSFRILINDGPLTNPARWYCGLKESYPESMKLAIDDNAMSAHPGWDKQLLGSNYYDGVDYKLNAYPESGAFVHVPPGELGSFHKAKRSQPINA